VNIEDQFARLVADAVAPMLADRLELLEERLVERLAGLVQVPPAASAPTTAPLTTAPLLALKDVAAQLRVGPRTVQRMVKAGEFPRPIPLSPGCSRWTQADLDAWLDARRGP